jgi:hypothetical protein
MFDAFDLPPLAAGLQWALMPGDATMFLAIVPAPLPGDYNSDGAVDAADYVVWRKTDGTPEGFNIWRANFGATVGSGSAVDTSSLIETGIPEPTTLVPLLLATMLRIARRPTAPLGRCHTA